MYTGTAGKQTGNKMNLKMEMVTRDYYQLLPDHGNTHLSDPMTPIIAGKLSATGHNIAPYTPISRLDLDHFKMMK